MKAKHVQLMIVKCIRNQVLRLPIETGARSISVLRLAIARLHDVSIRSISTSRSHAVGVVFSSGNTVLFLRVNKETSFDDYASTL